jgi:hypothetical protein
MAAGSPQPGFLRSRLNTFAIVNIASLTAAILAMATARYLSF